MANLKEIRTRITSVSSTRQITSAMKMVSAAKLKKAQDTILLMRPYAIKLQEILANLSDSDKSSTDNPYGKNREPHNVLIVVVTSNRGLCGAFNSNVIKLSLQLANEKYKNQLSNKKLFFLPIGRKANDFFTKKGFQVVKGNYNHLLDAPTFEKTASEGQMIINLFIEGNYDRIEVVYNQFKNAGIQITTVEQFLPIAKIPEKKKDPQMKTVHNDFIFEPTKEEIIKELIPKSLKVQLYKAILDSVASEHGARMTSMHKATDNATDLIKELKLQYNKARQASITNEILEIVAGAEALRG